LNWFRRHWILVLVFAGAAILLFRGLQVTEPPRAESSDRSLIAAGTLEMETARPAPLGDAPGAIGRSEAAPDPPTSEGVLLTITVIDPLALLDRPHTINLRRGNEKLWQSELGADRLNSFDDFAAWKREGEVITGRVRRWAPMPTHVTYSLDLAKPGLLDLAEAPITEVSEHHWSATLDLSACAAIVEFVVTDPARRTLGYDLSLAFVQVDGTQGELGSAQSRPQSLTVVAPIPCTIIAELNTRHGSPQAAQRTLFPMDAPGRYRHELQLSAGSVRVKFHDRGDHESTSSYSLQLTPELRRGGHLARSLISASPGSESVFELVPPGRYELWCMEQGRGSPTRFIHCRSFEVGEQETFLELFAPTDQRTLVVHHDAPAGTRFHLLRAGVSLQETREPVFCASAGAAVEFRGLDADEWIVLAFQGELRAVATVDTRWSSSAESALGPWQSPTEVELVLPATLAGVITIQLVAEGRRVTQLAVHADSSRTVRCPLLPGIVEVRGFHSSGVIAETSIFVPEASDDFLLQVPLNFRFP
jgi:hypothetical protein